MARGFYGRIRAYEEGIAGDDSVLGTALARNLFGTVRSSPAQLDALVAYVRAAAGALRDQAAADLFDGRIGFGCPAPCGPQPAGSPR
jgi:cytochrome b pre-mRNA-processing protein 3